MTINLYHGTKAAYIEDIKARGLIPCAKPGNDSVWQNAGRWQSPSRKHSVFVTPDEDTAAMFGAYLDEAHPAIVTIALPDSERWRLHIDEAGGGPDASTFLRFEGGIKPEWITGARELSKAELLQFALQGLLAA
jgi:hypothetical protein